ncbi:MAG TPA: hypothetical protein VGW37_02355, partial [Terriglobia bacterium]|nr:hypothetical protein [Terriglobia bacterium]
NGGISIDELSAFVSMHPDVMLTFGLLSSADRQTGIFLQTLGIYGYSVQDNPLALAGMEAQGPVIGMEIAAPFVVAAPYAIGEFATSAAGDYLFARGTGLLNSNDYLRIGWSWAGNARWSLGETMGQDTFRIAIWTAHVFPWYGLWPWQK